jgi:GMP synthase (glutamine-hydrolysing)
MTAPQQARQSTPPAASAHEKILIVDFGSQVTQLIARRVREEGVYSEIVPFQKAEAAFREMKPKAVILSGGPESVHEAGSPRAPQAIFDSGVPVLGICYGQMTMAAQLGGEVEGGHHREFGRADVEVKSPSSLFESTWGIGEKHPVWMSHGDRITRMPPGFTVAGVSPNAPFAIIQDEKRRYYGLMFHPEVVHTPDGAKLIRNFVRKVAGLTGDWTMRAFREEAIEKIRRQVGKGRVICGLSGGVDSAVAAALVQRAIGDRLTCVFVDHGLLRKDEAEITLVARDNYLFFTPFCTERSMLLIPGPTRKLRPDSKPTLPGSGGRNPAVLNCRYGSLLLPTPGFPVIRQRLAVSVAEPAIFVVALTPLIVQVGVYGVPLCNM